MTLPDMLLFAGHRCGGGRHHTITLIANAVSWNGDGGSVILTTRSLGAGRDDRSAQLAPSTVATFSRLSRHRAQHRRRNMVRSSGRSGSGVVKAIPVVPSQPASRWTPMSIPSTCTECG